MYPFSFREFLRARGFELRRYLSSGERSRLLSLLDEYTRWGGYPEAVIEPGRRERILREIWDVTVARDIVDRWGVRNLRVLRMLIRALQESREFSVHGFHRYLKSAGVRVSKNTLYNYLEYLHDSLVFFPLRKYSPSYKRLEASVPKVYLVDNGLYARKEVGMLLENLVFMELKRRGYRENEELYYWRDPTGKEVDFVVIGGRERQLVQVTYELTYRNLDRETRPLVKAARSLGVKSSVIVTWDQRQTLSLDSLQVEVLPLWRWLLRGGPGARL